MKFVLIPRGKFTIGSSVSEMRRIKEETQREVEITKSCCLGMHEVTQDKFEKVVAFNPAASQSARHGREEDGYEDWSKPGGGNDRLRHPGGWVQNSLSVAASAARTNAIWYQVDSPLCLPLHTRPPLPSRYETFARLRGAI
jgi:formylglycine-generating enzyme required for sulfatase activity